MDPAQFRHLFEQAAALPADRRRAFLRDHCPDPRARARLTRLLATDGRSSAPARPPAPESGIDGSSWARGSTRTDATRASLWTLQRRLGAGRSTSVFLATREIQDVTQHGVVSFWRCEPAPHRRRHDFECRRESLETLAHPNIARLIDGGGARQGGGYLIHEYVEGRPITDYACAAQLDVRDRLELMIVVCRAIAAAHRAQVIHGALRPGRLRVMADGAVKVVGLGIESPTGPATTTSAGCGTAGHPYSAPERLRTRRPTMACDVYALGVILHELLLGERPHRADRQQDSARVDELVTDLWRLPLPRSQLRATLRGGLDDLLARALAEEPQCRQASVDLLADDIERHLTLPTVETRASGGGIRTGTFLQRR